MEKNQLREIIKDKIIQHKHILQEPIYWKMFINLLSNEKQDNFLILKNLCIAIADVSERLDGGKGPEDGFSIRSSFANKIYFILFSMKNENNRDLIEEIIKECIMNATSYGVSAYLAKASLSPEHFSLTKQLYLDNERTRIEILKKLEERFIKYEEKNQSLLTDDFYDLAGVVAWTELSSLH